MSPRTTISWSLVSSSLPESLTQPQYSRQRFLEDVEYADTGLEGMLHNAHRVHGPITPSEEACLSSSRMSVSERTERPVVVSGQEPNVEPEQVYNSVGQKEQILAECQAEIKQHEFQAGWSRQNKCTKKSEVVVPRPGGLHCARAEELQRRVQELLHKRLYAAKFGITSSSSEKSQWNGRIEEVPEFHLRHYRKTKIRTLFSYLEPNTGIAKWNKLFEWFKTFLGCWINPQWSIPRYQLTCPLSHLSEILAEC